MKALIIYNGFSGKNKIDNKLEYIISRLKVKYNKVDLYKTKSRYDIKEYVISNASNYDTLIIIGGDGSINEAINGLILVKNKPLLAYIPAGTCNDFGNSLGLKKSLDKIIDIILEGETVLVNVNKINTDYFIYGMALGNFTEVSYDTSHNNKKRWGVIAYFIKAIKYLFIDNSFSCELVINDKVINKKCFCLMVLNSRFLASFKLRFKRILLNDNELRIVVINKKNRLINIIDLILFFLLGEKYNHNIEYYKANNIKIKSSELLRFNLDGENVPRLKEVNVNVIPKVFEVIVDKDIKNKYFHK